MDPLAQATRKNHTWGPGLRAMSGKAPPKPTEEDMRAVATVLELLFRLFSLETENPLRSKPRGYSRAWLRHHRPSGHLYLRTNTN